MPKKNTNSGSEYNLLSPINHIRFWEKGEMAYSALKKINEHKACLLYTSDAADE